MADVIKDGVAAFRQAVERWTTSPNPTDAAIALRAAPTVLEILKKAHTDLDDARRDRNGFVEEIRGLNDTVEWLRAQLHANGIEADR